VPGAYSVKIEFFEITGDVLMFELSRWVFVTARLTSQIEQQISSYSRSDQAVLKTKLTTPYDMTTDFYFQYLLERNDGLYNLA